MGTFELEYKIFGQGKTFLIIETGIGSSFYDWYSIVEEIKKYFTVVLYHRAGYGKSQVSDESRTTRNMAKELNELIEKIGIEDKFILMGHSFGGLCVQQYAKMYPNKLKGIVLIDSTSYNFKKLYRLNVPIMSDFIAIDKMIQWNVNASKKSKEELKIQNENIISSYIKRMSCSDMKNVEEFFTSNVLHKTIAEEFENWDRDSKDIKSISEFPNVPLIVIARDSKVAVESWIKYQIPKKEAVLYEALWRDLQIELSKLSNKGKLVIAENSEHEVYIDRPDIVIQCLKALR